jgi:hypothetical protein
MKIAQLTLLSLIGTKIKKNGRKLLLTLPSKYDKLLLTTYKEKKVQFTTGEPTFGTPATITEYKPEYDPKATIVVRKGYYYGTPSDSKFEVENAEDISRAFWRVDALQSTNNSNSRAQDKLKDYLVENFDEIGEEHATEIANIFGMDLSKTVDVEFNVTIKATISIPVNEDVSDLSVYDFDVEISSNESRYEVDEYDADIDSIDERY